METSIIKIGNSKGLRLSKTLIDKYDIKDKVELILEADQIIIKPLKQPRKNWDEAFKRMRMEGGDEILIDDVFDDENPEEWK